ncbi:hypothetical protein [Streptomyces sp. NBC_00299]|uniref:hypothetical protein n=1 Tax=Streptomyces sp. NBC_00299 TaxID=2975705 RepID=UPI002E29AC3D|nr:hypothetical protein [Streptomyces sp. NBC_00299]
MDAEPEDCQEQREDKSLSEALVPAGVARAAGRLLADTENASQGDYAVITWSCLRRGCMPESHWLAGRQRGDYVVITYGTPQ